VGVRGQSLDPRPRIMIGGVRPTPTANYYIILRTVDPQIVAPE